MIGKFLSSISLAALLLMGVAARAQPIHIQADAGKQEEPATKSVSGKVTSVTNQGTTFAVQTDGADKQVMEFIVAKDTQVKGNVKTGTLVTVEYKPTDDGRNVALTITAHA
jgi:hypothetical protein